MKDEKPKSELNYRDLSQYDKDQVAKLVKGGFSRPGRLRATLSWSAASDKLPFAIWYSAM